MMRLFVLLSLACAVIGCRTPSLSAVPSLPGSGRQELTNGMAYLHSPYPQCSWGMAAIWVRLAPADEAERHAMHVLEHILLRRLRPDRSPFFCDAATGDDWMYFRLAFVSDSAGADYRQALALLRTLFAPWQAGGREVEIAAREVDHELRRALTSAGDAALAVRVQSLHSRLFVPDNALLLMQSPPQEEPAARQAAEETLASLPRAQSPLAVVPLSPPDASFDCTVIGPPLQAGELVYAQLLPACIGYFLSRQGEQWQGEWWHSLGGNGFAFTRMDTEGTPATFATAWQESTAKPLARLLFDHLLARLRESWREPGYNPKAWGERLGKAWAGGYVDDLLRYPGLLETATPQAFYRWWRDYQPRCRIYQRDKQPKPMPAAPLTVTSDNRVQVKAERIGAACAADSPAAHAIGMWLAERMYQEIVGRGLAYYTSIRYYPESPDIRLEVSVETTAAARVQVTEILDKLLGQAPAAGAQAEVRQWAQRRAYLQRFLDY